MDIKMNKRFEYKDLPDMKSIMSDVDKLTKDLKIGQTLFLKEKGCKTEGEYKKKCLGNGHVMKHSHIGYNTWDTTKEACEKLYNELQKRGSYIDRFGFCMDNVMGLPEEWRKGQIQGTGLVMKNEDEWMQIGQIVPVQPHCGDMMIGMMNGVENCMNALRAGVTTIGNMSHYYNYEFPGIDREDHRTINTMTAVGIMGKFKEDGRKVLIAAADTFRAAAGDQLAEWARRAEVPMVGGNEGADPASVVFDAVNAAKARGVDVLLIDTAGRLHNKKNLMEELRKMNRIVDREFPDAHRENLIVLDGTTGQNALVQAREFGEVADLTGMIRTKMDGTAKGGIAVAIHAELGIPVKYIGVGESIDDLQKFDADTFVRALFTTGDGEEGENS